MKYAVPENAPNAAPRNHTKCRAITPNAAQHRATQSHQMPCRAAPDAAPRKSKCRASQIQMPRLANPNAAPRKSKCRASQIQMPRRANSNAAPSLTETPHSASSQYTTRHYSTRRVITVHAAYNHNTRRTITVYDVQSQYMTYNHSI